MICLTRRCGAWLPQVCSLFRASDRTPREAPIPLDAELINAFLSAVQTVLVQETGVSATRESRPGIDRSTTTPYEITAIIGITGDIAGMVMISMPKETALRFYSAVMGEEKTEADSIVASAIAEFTNTVAGTAAIALDDKGLSANISPPVVIHGKGASVSTLDLPRIAVPLKTGIGPMTVELAIAKVSPASG